MAGTIGDIEALSMWAGQSVALARRPQSGDVVDGIMYLESAPQVTGEVLHIDGGRIAGH